jgi:hypothetical protein
MNLNTLKRGFSRTNPEKGLRSLPGAQKSEHRDDLSGSIRVKGQYIVQDHDRAGRVLGIMAYGVSWICNGIILCLFILSLPPFVSEMLWERALLPIYLVLGFVLHIMVMLADGMRNSNAPWARKSIIVFWGGTGLFLAVYIPLLMMMPH